MKLSEHFNLEEFIASSYASTHKIDNSPNSIQIQNLKNLCEAVVEPVFDNYKQHIQINSGFRSERLNKAIGGSTTSQHCKGETVDMEIIGIPNKEVAQWIVDNLTFDQCILEFYNPKEGGNSGWIHVSYKENGPNRRELLIATKDGRSTIYKKVTKF